MSDRDSMTIVATQMALALISHEIAVRLWRASYLATGRSEPVVMVAVELQTFRERAEEAIQGLLPARHDAAVERAAYVHDLSVETLENALSTYAHALRHHGIPPAGPISTVEDSSMRTYTYPSKREGVEPHTVTVQDDGSVQCSCPGFTNRQACWHVTEAKERIALEQEADAKETR